MDGNMRKAQVEAKSKESFFHLIKHQILPMFDIKGV
jgi:hypothetical protein